MGLFYIFSMYYHILYYFTEHCHGSIIITIDFKRYVDHSILRPFFCTKTVMLDVRD